MEKKEKGAKKNGKNNYGFKAAAGTVLILALCVGIFFIADALSPLRNLGTREEFRDVMMNMSILVGTLSTLMVIVCAYLVFVYLKDYLELKSSFTLGILAAVVSLMIFAITVNPFFHLFFRMGADPGMFTLVPYVFATVALFILAWVSSR